ncbi:hypothetical protein HPP92_025869 [Vanilla planifolia]|uniref:Uncharacterized protein n=1 Tax=Vanilla planifolia TaxID=51239 RepID=A0A835U9R5_VANPL|nr:hypothetical protein HPP92_025869 [Vanilla planifolia]
MPIISRQSQRPRPVGSSKPYGSQVRSSGETSGPLPRGVSEAAAELLGDRVEELLKREENRPLLEGLEEASLRVERARATLADIESREAESAQLLLRLQDRQSEIEESQKELREARAIVEEAERSLSISMDEESSVFTKEAEAERWESIKAAGVSSIAGTLAGLPISLYHATSFPELSLHTAITFLLSALFGVTFRYTIRRDIDNFQLKTGTSAAFGLAKGLPGLEPRMLQDLNMESFVPHLIDGAISVSESIFIFLAAAIALDFCFKMRFLSPFPMKN